jgi:hypothetical protein
MDRKGPLNEVNTLIFLPDGFTKGRSRWRGVKNEGGVKLSVLYGNLRL